MSQVILLERVDNLGDLGEVVSVKPGYARNYLIPQQKALRATKDNIAYFEAQKSEIEKRNADNRAASQKEAKSLEGLTVSLIRHAGEGGQLYGSVTARDIAEIISKQSKVSVTRGKVILHSAIKNIGLFPITFSLHPEVKVDVTINIARSDDEAKIQMKTGEALIVDHDEAPKAPAAPEADAAKEKLLEETALEAEKEKSEQEVLDAKNKAEEKATASEENSDEKTEEEGEGKA